MSERFFDPTFVVQPERPRTLGSVTTFNALDARSVVNFRGQTRHLWPATADVFSAGEKVVFVEVDDVHSFLKESSSYPTRWHRPLTEWGEKFKANILIRYLLENNPSHRTYDRGTVVEIVDDTHLRVQRRSGKVQVLQVSYMDSPQPSNAFQVGDTCLIYSSKPGRDQVIGFADQAPRLSGTLIYTAAFPWVIESLSRNPDGTVTGVFMAPSLDPDDPDFGVLHPIIFDQMLNHHGKGSCPYRVSAPTPSSPEGHWEPSSIQEPRDIFARRSQFVENFGFIASRSLLSFTFNSGETWTHAPNGYPFDLVGGVRDALFYKGRIQTLGGIMGFAGSYMSFLKSNGAFDPSESYPSDPVTDRAMGLKRYGLHICRNDEYAQYYRQGIPVMWSESGPDAEHRFSYITVETPSDLVYPDSLTIPEFISDYLCIDAGGTHLFDGVNQLTRDPRTLKPKACIKLPDGSYRYLSGRYELWKCTGGAWSEYSLPIYPDWRVRALAIDGQGNTYYGVTYGANSKIIRFSAEQAI